MSNQSTLSQEQSVKEAERAKCEARHVPRSRSEYGSHGDETPIPSDSLAVMDDEIFEENPFGDEEDDGVTVIIRKTPAENNAGIQTAALPIVTPPLFSPVTLLTSTVAAFRFDTTNRAPAAIPVPPRHTTPFKQPTSSEELRRRQSAHDKQIRAMRSATKRRPSRRGDESD